MENNTSRMSVPHRRAILGAAVAAGALALAGVAAGAAEPVELLSFDGLYKSFGVLGFEFTDRVKALNGREVRLAGYMAPPLKAESRFFVLTQQPLAICPFCQSDADWPVDIVVVMMDSGTTLVSAGARIMVQGRLEIGSATDPASGFVSQIRIAHARFNAL